MKTNKKVRGYGLSVEASPTSFEGLLELAQQHNELEESKLIEALCSSAVNNEYQHPAAERFVIYHAEYICPLRYDMSLTEVLKSEEYNVKDASSVVKDAKSAWVEESGHSLRSDEWQKSVDAGECNYLFSLEQAQKCWDEDVLVFSGLGKKPKKVGIKAKAVWGERVVIVQGFLKDGQSPENIVSLMSSMWGGAEAVEAFVEKVQEMEPSK